MRARWRMALFCLVATGCAVESDSWSPNAAIAVPFRDILGDVVSTLLLQQPTEVRAFTSLECDGDPVCKDGHPQVTECELNDPDASPAFADSYTSCRLTCLDLHECFVQALAALPAMQEDGPPRECELRVQTCQIQTDACTALRVSTSPTLPAAVHACLPQDCAELARCLAQAVLQDGRDPELAD